MKSNKLGKPHLQHLSEQRITYICICKAFNISPFPSGRSYVDGKLGRFLPTLGSVQHQAPKVTEEKQADLLRIRQSVQGKIEKGMHALGAAPASWEESWKVVWMDTGVFCSFGTFGGYVRRAVR